jgi:hypothetical protein
MKVVMEAEQDSGSSFSWILERLGNHLFYGLYIFRATYNTKACLSFGRSITLSPIDHLFDCTDLLWY